MRIKETSTSSAQHRAANTCSSFYLPFSWTIVDRIENGTEKQTALKRTVDHLKLDRTEIFQADSPLPLYILPKSPQSYFTQSSHCPQTLHLVSTSLPDSYSTCSQLSTCRCSWTSLRRQASYCLLCFRIPLCGLLMKQAVEGWVQSSSPCEPKPVAPSAA